MGAPAYTVTRESLSIFWNGKMHTVSNDQPNFSALRKALIEEDWDSIPKNLTVAASISTWAKGAFTVVGNQFSYNGSQLPESFNQRIVDMASNNESPVPLFKFWERLQKNPSMRSVTQLWDFLKNEHIPITEDGCFLAYKSVTHDYKDVHTGTIGNRPGTVNKMPRNQISDDPNFACHEGFHVGAMGYVKSFHTGGQIIVCKVDPEHVVCVPYDASSQKMRVCEYLVLGNYGCDLPSTVFAEAGDSVSKEYFEKEYAKGKDAFKDDLGSDEDDDEENDDDSFNQCDEDPEASIEESSAKSAARAERAAEVKKAAPAGSVQTKRETKPGFSKLNKMDLGALMEQSIEELRRYATHGLQVVGASKIPGGKLALIKRILELRK